MMYIREVIGISLQGGFRQQSQMGPLEMTSINGMSLAFLLNLERLLCPIFLGNKIPLKPATIALKIGHLAFQEPRNQWRQLVNGGPTEGIIT